MYLPGTDCPIFRQASLESLTSFRVGGAAEWYLAPRSWEALQTSFEWAQSQGLPLTVLGAGSNLLVSDHGVDGLAVGTRYLRDTQFDPNTGQVSAGAGKPIATLAWQLAKRGWQGMEWAVGIPGTVGGAVAMNAGAHHSSVADVLVSALVLSPDGTIEELTPQDLGYSYRTSILQGDNRLVVQATFQLQPGATKAEVMTTTQQNLQQRKSSQPYHLPSCGSVFRNPDSHSAGWLIEQMGLKGYQIGGAQVAHRHANFILNCNGAKADDIFRLIRYIQEQVEYHWSISLKPEVRLLGKF
ncbi:MAG: UDP-N-acetylenolpyruvoylglucosamine reductase [Cyanobacteria bacterium QH_2_48_84]|nr:MAG: UDP-N-acetylenolpyruvoylglucosamine reductase [Cyanobacteria bacterium QH_2_48_84]